MTREEAKHRLLNIERCTPIHTREDVRNFEALKMAIKALEQNESAEEWYKLFVEKLEQEPCGDAISRQATIEAFQMFRGYEANRTNAEWVDRIETVVEKLPPVNPQKSSRDMEEIDEIINCDADAETKCKMISNILTAKPHYFEKQEPKTGHWIPVSERLPEEAFGCLVTIFDTDLKTQDEFENILPYFVGYDGETWNNADGEPIPFEVVAWMPLPEPYKVESEDI